jgi:hypothetical protein
MKTSERSNDRAFAEEVDQSLREAQHPLFQLVEEVLRCCEVSSPNGPTTILSDAVSALPISYLIGSVCAKLGDSNPRPSIYNIANSTKLADNLLHREAVNRFYTKLRISEGGVAIVTDYISTGRAVQRILDGVGLTPNADELERIDVLAVGSSRYGMGHQVLFRESDTELQCSSSQRWCPKFYHEKLGREMGYRNRPGFAQALLNPLRGYSARARIVREKIHELALEF